jgi:hypothetical protein
MKSFKYISGLFIASILLLIACQKKEITKYQQDSRLFVRIPDNFNSALSQDSLVYSFPYKPALTYDTIWFEANIMGSPASTDRTFALNIDGTTTAIQGTDFDSISGGVIPAGAFKAKIPIVIHKTPAIKVSPVRLQLSVKENQNFKIGFDGKTQAVFVWADRFLQPASWTSTSNYANCFGAFSQSKVQFILDSCHISSLPDQNNLALMAYYNQVLRNAMTNYYKVHFKYPPDDNGTSTLYIPVFGTPGVG